MSACSAPLPWDTLVDYWASALPATEAEAVEEHLFGCAGCTEQASRVAAITEALRTAIPPAVTRRRVERLRAEGVAVREHAFAPGERRDVLFERDTALLVHRLGGLELESATRVGLRIVSESTGERMVELDSVPFERAEGAVLIACQRHYAALPHDTVFELSIERAGGAVEQASFTVLHHFV